MIQPELLDYSKGLLKRSEAEAVRVHLDTCAECAALLNEEVAFDRSLAAMPEEHPANDVWALVRARTRPKRYSPAVLLRGFVAPRVRRALAFAGAVAAVVAVFHGVTPTVPETTPNYTPEAVASAVVPVADEPLASHADALIDVLEGM